jgi:branched-chain amino acid transport system permease protein
VHPVAGAVCLLAGFLFGLPALRLEGVYLALATFALGVALPQLLKYKHLEEWTGGVQGISLIKPDPPFARCSGCSSIPTAGCSCSRWPSTVLMFVLGWNLLRGRVGPALIAIRDQPIAAATMGIDNALYKSLAFGVSAMFTGVAGALGAIAVAFVAPDSFTIFLSISLLVGMVVGGLASITGALWGALFIQFVPNLADQISKAAPWAIYGALMIVFMYVMPTGIAGALRLAWLRLAARPAGTPQRRDRRYPSLKGPSMSIQDAPSGALGSRWRAPRLAQKQYGPAPATPRSRSATPSRTAARPRPTGSSARSRPAYFKMINEQGGINGRKINYISLDDGYSPPKTVEMVRKLVEQDEVLFTSARWARRRTRRSTST